MLYIWFFSNKFDLFWATTVFNHSFVLAKFGHLAQTKVNTMKPSGTLWSKKPFFLPTIKLRKYFDKNLQTFWRIRWYFTLFSKKLWSLTAFYSHKQNAAVINYFKQKKIHLILSIFLWWTIWVSCLQQILNSSSKFLFWPFQIWIKI